jgi:hypothetical protein
MRQRQDSSIVPPAYVDPKTGARQRPDSPTIGDSPIRVELALDRLVRQASIWPWIFLLRLDTVLGLTRVVPHSVGDVLHPPYRHAGRCR